MFKLKNKFCSLLYTFPKTLINLQNRCQDCIPNHRIYHKYYPKPTYKPIETERNLSKWPQYGQPAQTNKNPSWAWFDTTVKQYWWWCQQIWPRESMLYHEQWILIYVCTYQWMAPMCRGLELYQCWVWGCFVHGVEDFNDEEPPLLDDGLEDTGVW